MESRYIQVFNQTKLPMEQKSTILKKQKSPRLFSPRKFIINNILNYSKAMMLVNLPMNNSFVVMNN